MSKNKTTIGDFSILPISIPPVSSYARPVLHHLYVRRNAPKVPTENDSRSLFLANVPVDSTDLHLRGIFTALVGAGRFEGVTFEDERKSGSYLRPDDVLPAQALRLAVHSKKRKREEDKEKDREKEESLSRLPPTWTRPLHRTGSTAVVLLADEKSVERALKAIAKTHKTRQYPTWGAAVADRVPPLGSRWLRAHARLSYPDRSVVEESVNTFFTMFNRREKEAAELAKRLRNEPDEDGFVTVTRGGGGPGGKGAPARMSEAEEARRKMLEKEEKKRTELNNFYRFQLRERKKAEQAELLKRFEEDRKKVAAMREKRGKFRPET
ncbi:hypothetical protein VTK73DRAFT_1434 [Phialemonium thermophilum]|uniref:Ribosomal RNA-processing protein 7 n=1 Tax=Phialemonium thermophilum TaxID=223376 RepID=A0ABR3X9X0_9PEZI